MSISRSPYYFFREDFKEGVKLKLGGTGSVIKKNAQKQGTKENNTEPQGKRTLNINKGTRQRNKEQD